MMHHTAGVKSAARVVCASILAVSVLCMLMFVSAARAAEAPRWQVTVTTEPTHVVPGSPKAGVEAPRLVVVATNVGGAATGGGTITLSDVLGSGLTATGVLGYDAYRSGKASDGKSYADRAPLSCAAPPTVSCTWSGSVDPGDQLVMTVTFDASDAHGGETIANLASVSGGGAQPASSGAAVVISETPAPFGPVPGSVLAALSTSQAGAHPNITTAFTLNTSKSYGASGDVKDVRFDLPPGLVGSTVGVPRCSMAKVVEEEQHPGLCPADAMVGIATINVVEPDTNELNTFVAPVYNIVPSPGEPAAFAFDGIILPVRLDTSVLSNGDYGVRVTAPSITEEAQTISSWVTIWGVPAEHSGPGQDLTEGAHVTEGEEGSFGSPDPGQSRVPLLTNPQQCTEPLIADMTTDSWENPGDFTSEAEGEANMGLMTGCDQVPFSTAFTFLPDTFEAGAPAGYQFNLTVPQKNEPETLATASVKDVALKLPEGVVINPSAAWGLQSCSNDQFYGPGRGPGHLVQEPAQEGHCPDASKIGEIEVKSPDLEETLKGSVYLASPECDPCTPADAADGKMARLFIELVGEGESGIVVKQEGHTDINQSTGQVTAVFSDLPQLPFSHMRFVLEGGPRAVLANPRTCGPVRTEGDFTPWNTGPGVSDSTPSYEFEIKQNCFGARFNPSFKAGVTNLQAGEHTPLTVSFGREDDEQYLSGLEVKTPPGLLGSLVGIPLCAQAQAEVGECSEASLIGHTQVLTGPGADPFLVSGGRIYLTEGYGGAPYGLSIVVPAVAGPYTLAGTTGKGTVVVRARIEVSPTTAALTVKLNPPGSSGSIPTMLDGIPLQLRVVNATVERPGGFTFNPTNCDKQSIEGVLASTEGMSSSVSSSFQVTNCANLKFEPQFTASTSGKTNKTSGASLSVRLAQPPTAAFGTLANVAQAKVELPLQLPSRLTTLQKACTSAQFHTNPAGCPVASIVGHAIVHTPVLPVALEGPAYFVSNGGEAFPNLIMVLQGYGVTVDLVGDTDIKNGITSSTFKTVPDVPFNTFELTLPEGPYSALAANANLCASKLVMPTEFTGQNGAQLKQDTVMEVEGCSNTISISSHKIKNKTVTVKVYVPAAGKVKLSGTGLTPNTKTAKGRETLTFNVNQKKAGKLRTKLKVIFTPSTGEVRKRQVKTLKLYFRK